MKNIYSKNNWQFNSYVSKVFDNHVKRSVPFYEISHELTARLSEFFLYNNSVYYDLGCSTGTLIKTIKKNNNKKINFFGVDNSESMIKMAKKNCKFANFINKDLINLKMKKSSFISCLYTLQFINLNHRSIILKKIYKSLSKDGSLVFFEKVRFNDSRSQELFNSIYYDFKLENKFTHKEILDKERSLRGAMAPLTLNENLKLLKMAGFKKIIPICQYLFFVGLLCIK